MLWVEIYLRRKSSRVWCEGGLNARFLYKVFIYVLFIESIKISTLLLKYGDVNMKNKDTPPKTLKNKIRFIQQFERLSEANWIPNNKIKDDGRKKLELCNVGWFMGGAFK
ncbi:hypothetical protein COI44_13240 [Bacillus sp. AFS088145]|nr:hypothetical protein COI44_13240 [Bacillus sp. AFS088145]